MANFEMLDAEEHSFVKKPRPVGWFAAGVILIAALGFVLGMYLPLSSAHETLLTAHEELAKKSADLDQALRKKSSTLDDTEARRAELAGFVQSARQKEKNLANQVDQTAATATNQLEVYFKSKLVSVNPSKENVKITIDERILFRPRSSTVSPQAIRPLCGIGKAIAQEKEWTLTIKARAPNSEKDYWEKAAERAGGLAESLEKRCGVSATQIRAVAEKLDDEDKASSEVDFILAPREPLQLRGEDAPLKE